jgi:hypothetical protein
MRWINSINRVLIQNAVKRYSVLIEAFEAKLKAQKISSFSNPNTAPGSPTASSKAKTL